MRVRALVTALVLFALAASAAALIFDTFPNGLSQAAHSAVSPAPLFLIGAAFVTLQVWLRPRLGLLAKRAMVAAPFCCGVSFSYCRLAPWRPCSVTW